LIGDKTKKTKSSQMPLELIGSNRIRNVAPIIRQAWRLVMENHPHDSICGCSIDEVHEEMKVRFNQVEQIGEEITKQSLKSLASFVRTDLAQRASDNLPSIGEAQSAIIVYNPSSTARSDIVTATIELPPNVTEFDLVTEDEASLPYQEHGLGTHEIINMTLDPRGLQSAFAYIADGHAAGMNIQDIKVCRSGAEVFIETIMTDSGEPNLAVWNTKRREIEVYLADSSISTYHVRANSTSSTQFVVSVPDVPGFGYRTLWVRARRDKEKTPIHLGPLIKALLPLSRIPFIQNLVTRKRYARPPYKIENDCFIVEALKNGTLTVQEKQTNFIYPGLNRFIDGGDCGDEYNYSPPATDRMTTARLKHVRITRGHVQQVLDLELELITPFALAPHRKSRSIEQTTIPISTTIVLMNGVPRVDIRTTVNNRARDHRLRVHFPAPFASETGSHDGHFEVVDRISDVPAFDETWVEQPRPEVPQRAFSSVTDGKSGLTIANRGLTEVEVLKNSAGNAEIVVTLLRCVGWLSRDDFKTRNGHAGPFLETPGAQMPGIWKFDYSIIPHAGDWKKAFTQAYAFETPMRLACTDLHGGTLPASGSFVKVEPATFVATAIKQSEEGNGWLVRGYNITGEAIHVTLKPCKRFKKVEQVNLAEEKLATLKPDKDGRVFIPVRGHEIVSVLFRT